jgi:cytochrome c-type biogenesis protein CcmE
MKLLIPVGLITLGLAGLITMGVLQAGVPELQVHQLMAGAHPGREVKLHGKIGKIHSEVRPLRFSVVDKDKPGVVVEVVCDATKPDTFQETYDVAVQGKYAADQQVFRGDRIFTKCPSKYEGLEKVGLDKDGKPLAGAASQPASQPAR